MKITKLQNRALHKWYDLLAKHMAARGMDLRQVLKPGIEITPTMMLVKDYIWRPVQIAKYNKQSVTEIDSSELQKIHKDIDKFFLQENKIDIPFPSQDNLHLIEHLVKEFNL